MENYYLKDHTEEPLDTVFLLSLFATLNMDVVQSTVRAKKKVFIVKAGVAQKPKHLTFFDEVVTIDAESKDEEYATVLECMKKRMGDPQKTRVAIQGCLSSVMAALLREELGIPGPRPEQIKLFVDKVVMKERLKDYEVKLPNHVLIDKKKLRSDKAAYGETIKKQIGLPMFFKHTTGTSAVGHAKVTNDAELARALDMVSEAEEEYEVEEFVDATTVSLDYVVVSVGFYLSTSSTSSSTWIEPDRTTRLLS